VTSDDHALLQERFAPAVSANRLHLDPLWDHPCLAYNLHARPDDSCRRQLSEIQDDLARLGEDGLLRCPPVSLHVSLGAFLFVREDYAEPKERLWARHGRQWLQDLVPLLGPVPAFTLSYRGAVVTDSAVIAVADCPKEVEAIREAVTRLRSASGLDGAQPTIVHTTLFRFGAALRNTAALLEATKRILVDARFRVQEIVVTREELYPSLVTKDLSRLPLAPLHTRNGVNADQDLLCP